MKRIVKIVKVCESKLPKPTERVCPWPDCGAVLKFQHWACRAHWGLYPQRFRLYANSMTKLWEGDPHYDHFIRLAREIGDRTSRGQTQTFTVEWRSNEASFVEKHSRQVSTDGLSSTTVTIVPDEPPEAPQ